MARLPAHETGAGATLGPDRSGTIRTLDDLLAACDVDLSRWTVARYVVNKWDSVQRSDGGPIVTQLYQVRRGWNRSRGWTQRASYSRAYSLT